ALRHRFAFLLEPGKQLSGFLRHFERGHHDADGHQSPAPTCCSVRALASTISLTFWLGGGSCSRVVASGPSTVMYWVPATSSFSAGKRVITSWPVSVTTISSSMRAALQPSFEG